MNMHAFHSGFWLPLLTGMLVILLQPVSATAHRLVVFAYPSGNEIVVEGHFSGGRPVAGGDVTVQDPRSSNILVTGRTDDAGMFRFPRPASFPETGLRITVAAGEGHQGEWMLLPDAVTDAAVGEDRPVAAVSATGTDRQVEAGSTSCQQCVTMLEQVVVREVEPLKHMLAEHVNQGPTFREIFGGIGWLVGIGGLLFALLKQRGQGE